MPKLAVAFVVATFLAPLPLAADATAPATEGAPEQRRLLVAKIEHFFASAPDAERLFLFFRDTLQLPQVWAYQTWGEFASGGVSLGNVAFELVWWQVPAGEELSTEFAGIAFEPAGPTDAAVAELARRGIAYDAPQPNVHVNASGQKVGWVNTGLPELAPWNVFFCDYLARERVAEGRGRASEELARREGGPLTVLRLEEIVLGAAEIETARRHWRKLLESPDQEANDVFTFGDGPRIRLVPAANAAMQGLVVRVRSLERARSFLAEHDLLGEASAGVVTIAPKAIGGLSITLVDSSVPLRAPTAATNPLPTDGPSESAKLGA